MEAWFTRHHPMAPDENEGVYRRTIKAKALDTTRGLLPAATRSNVGIYGTGQAYEALLLRMRASPLAEVRDYAGQMLTELRKVIPAFLKRVDQRDRGEAWSAYLAETAAATAEVARTVAGAGPPAGVDEITLTDFDPDGEIKVVAAALYAVTDLADRQLLERVRAMTAGERACVLEAYVGSRENRRHKPGRAFERTSYRFDILSDYGGFRDLQRHRLLTIEWQQLTTDHGYETPPEFVEAGVDPDFVRVMESARELHDALRDAGVAHVAPYAVPMAYRVRYYMEMNAREAMHLIELRTSPAGHPGYRRICQAMHRLIGERHRAIAATMKFVDYSGVDLARLEAERRTEAKRQARETKGGTG
jgi:thymidylate synthase ThyX